MGIVYLIRLDRPLGSSRHSAQFYLGSCCNLVKRMEQHTSGRGAAMLRAANERGIGYHVCKMHRLPTIAEARRLERNLKAQHNNPSLLTRDWSRYL